MYEHFYALEADPFRLSPDHRFCFTHRNYARARSYIDYALHRGEGFVMITGHPGTGKTTLINDLLERLPAQEVAVSMLVSTQLAAEDLLRMTAYGFGLRAAASHKAEVLQGLMAFLERQHQAGRRALLIIDEAQDLAATALEELRLLTNLQRQGRPLLQIVLVGQEHLRELVQGPDMAQVHQRLVAAWHLEPLGPVETLAYVRHRLEMGGWRGDPAFAPGVLRTVFEFSAGVPRRINLICSRLLLRGFIEERHRIALEDAEQVLDELHQEALTAATQAGGDVDWDELDQGLCAAPETPPAAVAVVPAETVVAPELEVALSEELLALEAAAGDAPTPACEPLLPDEFDEAFDEPAPAPLPRRARGRWLLGGATLAASALLGASYLLQPQWAAALQQQARDWLERSLPGAVAEFAGVDPESLATPERSRVLGSSSVLAGDGAGEGAAVVTVQPPLQPSAVTPVTPVVESLSPVLASSPAVSGARVAPAPEPAAVARVTAAGEDQETPVLQVADTRSLTPSALRAETLAGPGGALPDPVQVVFAWNSTELEPRFAARLDILIEQLQRRTDLDAEVVGYSDPYGDPDYNLALSRRRAQAVAVYLVAGGVERARLLVEGRGPLEPGALTRQSAEARAARGRVVEVLVQPRADEARG
ncbi:AAA family ATPase [Marichromatium bheemlicum]|uniref:AAA family ATPase n=1 Tax=Marichromatium bheemlicum TaxID=365339 RepID=A0ABX1IAY4_9GAMM|nr:AAA family ATPase [Marichromatium bheemlicum]NKN33357.1 AAA family ATPase [Marichromatium bheemlicum]